MSGMQLYGTEATEYCATGTAGDSDDEKGEILLWVIP